MFFNIPYCFRSTLAGLIILAAAAGCAGVHSAPPVRAAEPVLLRDAAQRSRLKRQLDSIGVEDQRYRGKLQYISATAGGRSPAMKALLDSMQYTDSLNMLVVANIIDTYGWPGPNDIGTDANDALFMVVQHSTLADQQKYLPAMRRAVAAGNANGSSLALLEDRVALREGKAQRYGSQISWDMATNVYYVLPLAEPDSVDKRRAALGLVPMATYILERISFLYASTSQTRLQQSRI